MNCELLRFIGNQMQLHRPTIGQPMDGLKLGSFQNFSGESSGDSCQYIAYFFAHFSDFRTYEYIHTRLPCHPGEHFFS